MPFKNFSKLIYPQSNSHLFRTSLKSGYCLPKKIMMFFTDAIEFYAHVRSATRLMSAVYKTAKQQQNGVG